jgi:hypothetical protein
MENSTRRQKAGPVCNGKTGFFYKNSLYKICRSIIKSDQNVSLFQILKFVTVINKNHKILK